MKYFFANLFALLVVSVANAQTRSGDTTYLEPVEVTTVRAAEKTPVAKTNLSQKEIEKNNLGQDLPFLLNQTPSVIVNSDAGNGIGYTGIRIRGSDASRINVTLNGIPYNDAESQGTFFVDLPDFASSAGSIQVQRGVGTSSNGAGSFGGTINISTNEVIKKKSFELNNSFGSYHSFKNTLQLHSGIFAKHFTVDGRLSNIRSDGYIERASSRLQSFFTSFAFIGEKNSLRFNISSGKEKTYQAWNGVDAQTLRTNRRYNSAGTEKPGDPYANETDNYVQTHYQLFYNHTFSNAWKMNAALFLTKGKGYYEQYKANEELAAYGLPDYNDGTGVIQHTDLVRRLWLDNDFYGGIFSFHYNNTDRNIILSGSWNGYDGKHFGEIIRATVQQAVPANYRWYDVTAYKKDYSAYGKWTEILSKDWQTYLDLQVRKVDYTINGFADNPMLQQQANYFFFNPKAGITYTKNKTQAYFSFARANKEPNRDDFEAGKNILPRAETLNDFEAGIEKKNARNKWGINLYYMLYKDQLVLTGKINDVGAYTRTNVSNSYRAGIELQGNHVFTKWLSVNGNLTLSANKIKDFTEYIDDYDNGGQQTKQYAKTNLPFSPQTVSAVSVNIFPFEKAEINVAGKYVSRQYLDNTSQRSRSLDPYYVQDIRMSYGWEKGDQSVKLFLLVNNLLSKKYEANGYTFSYIYTNRLTTENYYFPMAPVNVMIGINVKF
jgi:iron complex outermembrane receptor protein